MIRNLTPHAVTVEHVDGGSVTYEPAGKPPRLTELASPLGTVAGHRILHVGYGPTVDLPPQEPGVTLIVSQLVCEANPDRSDLVSPTDLIRDGSGRVTGCRALRASAGMLRALS